MKRLKALKKVIRRSKTTDMVTRHENRERRRSRIYQIRNQQASTNKAGSDIITTMKVDRSIH